MKWALYPIVTATENGIEKMGLMATSKGVHIVPTTGRENICKNDVVVVV